MREKGDGWTAGSFLFLLCFLFHLVFLLLLVIMSLCFITRFSSGGGLRGAAGPLSSRCFSLSRDGDFLRVTRRIRTLFAACAGFYTCYPCVVRQVLERMGKYCVRLIEPPCDDLSDLCLRRARIRRAVMLALNGFAFQAYYEEMMRNLFEHSSVRRNVD